MHFVFAAVILVHGLIHLAGFAKALGWAVPLQHGVSNAAGLAWLGTAALFVTGSVLVATQRAGWWLPTLVALLASQILIATAWSDAKFGTVLNLAILLPLVVALLDHRRSSFSRLYQEEVRQRLAVRSEPVPVSEPDVAHLPRAVRRYLELTGSIGRPRVSNFHAKMIGEIRPSMDAGWMRFEVDQHSFFDDPTRLFLLRASRYGVPFDALHRYVGTAATMQVRVASLFTAVDARGPEMNQSETVTMFNDMCLLAPATLIDRSIAWKQLDPLTVAATFSRAGQVVSAVLSFDESGELTNFRSDDRYLSADGKSYTKYRWSTPMRDYREFGGRRVPTRGEASWRLEGGEFVYARIEITSIEYNVGPR